MSASGTEKPLPVKQKQEIIPWNSISQFEWSDQRKVKVMLGHATKSLKNFNFELTLQVLTNENYKELLFWK